MNTGSIYVRKAPAVRKWAAAHKSNPESLAAQRHERARIRSEKGHRWGRPKTRITKAVTWPTFMANARPQNSTATPRGQDSPCVETVSSARGEVGTSLSWKGSECIARVSLHPVADLMAGVFR